MEAGSLPAEGVRAMFDRIAPVYDAMNRVMTAGLDGRWRRETAEAVVSPGDSVLDTCCGTGDLAIACARAGGRVTGLDFSERMLERARRKSGEIEWVQGDALALPFEDDSFDAATVGFGVRNLEDLDRGLAELARVLGRAAGRALEITRPKGCSRRSASFGGIVPVPETARRLRVHLPARQREALPGPGPCPLPARRASRTCATGSSRAGSSRSTGAAQPRDDPREPWARRLPDRLGSVWLRRSTCARSRVDGRGRGAAAGGCGRCSSPDGAPAGAARGGCRGRARPHRDARPRRSSTALRTAGPGCCVGDPWPEAARAAGDFCSRAHSELAATGDHQAVRFLATATRSSAQEALQRARSHDPDTTVESYLDRCALKTGKLFEAACLLGSGGDRNLGAFGLALGIAFQIADDILDCSGETIETGKIAGTDLREGTPTLPLILAARVDASVRTALAGGPLNGALIRVAETGALDEARGVAPRLRTPRSCLASTATSAGRSSRLSPTPS